MKNFYITLFSIGMALSLVAIFPKEGPVGLVGGFMLSFSALKLLDRKGFLK